MPCHERGQPEKTQDVPFTGLVANVPRQGEGFVKVRHSAGNVPPFQRQQAQVGKRRGLAVRSPLLRAQEKLLRFVERG